MRDRGRAVQLDIGYQTQAGMGRARNEDCLGMWVPEPGEEAATRGFLLVVADGTGHDDAGEVVSRTAVEAMLRIYYGPGFVTAEQALRRAVETANEIVAYERQQYAAPIGIGTALAAAVVLGDKLFTANVGDVRVYHLRGETLRQLSRDHHWDPASRQAIALGIQSDIEVHLTSDTHLEPGDVILVCSDGVWEAVPAQRMAALLAAHSAQAAADALVAAAQEHGPTGDLTAIVAHCLGDG
jgi:serine/threonine protein phosphatase PrpC